MTWGADVVHAPLPHPRLLATASDWERLRQRLRTEPDLAQFHAALLEHAQALRGQGELERKLQERRLLGVSRALQQRLWLWAYAWQTTGEAQWAERAAQELQAACAFADWNPAHFLDVAEACAAVAVAYDWLYPALDDATRQACVRALQQLALQPGASNAPHNSWQTRDNNWNQVCFGGLVLGALAVQEAAPALAQRVLDMARQGIVHGLGVYAPDGVYPEGPSYWGYGTGYQVLMIAALRSAGQGDGALPSTPGFLASAAAYVQLQGPSGRAFNYADGGENQGLETALFWFARESGHGALLVHERERLRSPKACLQAVRGQRMAPLAALWWPAPGAASPLLPTEWSGQGSVPLWVWRERWGDPQALFVATKGGSAALNHAHMDAGSFVLERDGVRWAIDLGMQDYHSLESRGVDLWNRRQDSPRWQVFRLGNAGHGTLSLGEALHRVEGHATLRTLDGADGPGAEIDLRAVLGTGLSQAQRRLQVQGRSVLLSDRLQGLAPGAPVRWQMLTRAQAEVQGRNVLLRQGGQAFWLRDHSPRGTRWALWSAAQPEPDTNAANPGVTVVQLHAQADAHGGVDLRVVLGG
ncbi:MAG: heparinase II/III domain-containing protein [Rhodoferax sp.]